MPEERFSDFTSVLKASQSFDPYFATNLPALNYPPFVFLIFGVISWLGSNLALEFWFFSFVFCSLFFALRIAEAMTLSDESANSLGANQTTRFEFPKVILAAAFFVLWFPAWIAFDRGNFDLWIFVVLFLALLQIEKNVRVAAFLFAISVSIKRFTLGLCNRGSWNLVCDEHPQLDALPQYSIRSTSGCFFSRLIFIVFEDCASRRLRDLVVDTTSQILFQPNVYIGNSLHLSVPSDFQ